MNDENEISRRRLLTGGAAFASALGLPIPFSRFLPRGVVPVALAQTAGGDEWGKEGLTLLADRPLGMETPAHLLDDDVTPAARFFVRNNGHVPELGPVADDEWTLEISGEVERSLRLSIADLKEHFEHVMLRLPIECAGNGRRFFSPGTSGM